jgi:hypothetical protein
MPVDILDIAGIYGLLGACVAIVFLLWGIDRVDPNARGAWTFRPLLVPGVVLIWPLVLWRWWRVSRGETLGKRHRPPRLAQDYLALALALAIPVFLFAALLARQNGPYERPAVMLEGPAAEQGEAAQ